MIIIGLDPSFRKTGIAVVNTTEKTVKIASYGDPIGGNSFKEVFRAAQNSVNGILNIINDVKPDIIISETPPSSGQYGAGLYGLDFYLLGSIIYLFPNITVYGVTPNWLGHVHGKRQWKKSESVELAKGMLARLRDVGYSVPEGRISADCAEAFIFTARILSKEGLSLFSDIKGLQDEKEFLLSNSK